jgi:hypothetical protein
MQMDVGSIMQQCPAWGGIWHYPPHTCTQLLLTVCVLPTQVTAAEVVISHGALGGADDAASPWHHITLVLGPGHMPAESLQLPARIADPHDPAQRVVVDPPLVLQGVIKAHR